MTPALAQAQNNRGNALKLLGRLPEALASLDRAVEAAPKYALAWSNRAAVLRALGRHADAVASADRALALNPKLAEAHANRGGAQNGLGRHEEALASSDRAIALRADLADAYVVRGLALVALARPEEALAAFDQALALRADSVEAVYGRGAALHLAKRHDEALKSYDRALELEPKLVAAMNGRAGIFHEQKRLDEALAEWQRALAIDPNLPQIHHNCGAALFEAGRCDEAIASYDRALALKPDFAKALHNRVAALSRLMRYEEALATSDRLLALEPDNAGAHHNRGSALSSLMRFGEAVDAYSRALALKPDAVESLENRASVLAYLTRHDEAARDFAHVLVLDPDYTYVRGALQSSRQHCCDWRDYDDAVARLAADAEAGKRVSDPFPFVTTTWSAPAQLRCAQTWAQDKLPPAATPLWRGERYAHDRIRVAYVSADFHEHATAYLMAGVFERHDRARFETIGVSFGPDSQARCARGCAPPSTASSTSASDRRRGRRDAARDGGRHRRRPEGLHGRQPDRDLRAYARRRSRSTTSAIPERWARRTSTTSSPTDVIVPPEARQCALHREGRLPARHATRPTTTRARSPPETPSRGGARACPSRVSCSARFNNSYKITPAVFDVWMRLLRSVAGSVLWLLAGQSRGGRQPARARRRRAAWRRSAWSSRPRNAAATISRGSGCADLFLDTLPVNAHTTASDALWAGLPVLTCPGGTFAGARRRKPAACGRPARTGDGVLPDYEALALALARDPERLAGLRARLARNARLPTVRHRPLRRHLEAAYLAMWERHQRGEAPAAFAVPGPA